MKSYGFLSFAKNIVKTIGKNISKNLSSKYNQKLLDHAKKSATDALKTSSWSVIQKTAEATGELIGNKIAAAGTQSYYDRITKGSKSSQQNNSKRVTMGMVKKYLKKDIYLQNNNKQVLII